MPVGVVPHQPVGTLTCILISIAWQLAYLLHILCGTVAACAALLCETKRRRSLNPFENLAVRAGPPGSCMPPAPWSSGGGEALDVRWRRLPGLLAASGGSAAIFEALHGGDPLADTFWLDR